MKRDLIPDPTRYYVKDDPVYTTAYYPELSMIPPELSMIPPELSMIPSRYTRPLYPGTGTITSTKTIPAYDVLNTHKYDICVNSELKTEDELSYHVRTTHDIDTIYNKRVIVYFIPYYYSWGLFLSYVIKKLLSNQSFARCATSTSL
jgi:hypothetical protein